MSSDVLVRLPQVRQISVPSTRSPRCHVRFKKKDPLNIVDHRTVKNRCLFRNSSGSDVERIQELSSFTDEGGYTGACSTEHRRQILCVPVPQIQEQVIVQEIPQVVVSLSRVCCTHVEPSRSVATTQPRIRCQEIPEVQFVERIQEQIVETIKVVSQEHATQRTSEQIEVQMNTNSIQVDH